MSLQKVWKGECDVPVMKCRKEYQGEPLAMEADAEAEDADEDLEVLVSVFRQILTPNEQVT